MNEIVMTAVIGPLVWIATRFAMNGTHKQLDNVELGLHRVNKSAAEALERVSRLEGRVDSTHDLVERLTAHVATRPAKKGRK